jgi:hypothetical protein
MATADTPSIRLMARSIMVMAAGVAGTMAGIIATGITAEATVLRTAVEASMVGSAGMAAEADMAAEATAKPRDPGGPSSW